MSSRRFPSLERFKSKEFAPYVQAVGQSTLAWNELHEWLAMLFNIALENPERSLAYRIWYSSNQDRACRAMLEAISDQIRLKHGGRYPNADRDLSWLLNEIQKLEDARNNIVHTPLFMYGKSRSKHERMVSAIMGITEPTVRVNSAMGHKRAKKLETKDLLTEYRWCRDTALTLRDYTADIVRTLHQQPRVWPKRPALPNRGKKAT